VVLATEKVSSPLDFVTRQLLEACLKTPKVHKPDLMHSVGFCSSERFAVCVLHPDFRIFSKHSLILSESLRTGSLSLVEQQFIILLKFDTEKDNSRYYANVGED